MYAFVSIHGSPPLRLLVDTGAPVHSICERVAAELGLVADGTILLRDYARNERHQATVRVDSMRVGPLKLSDFDLVIVPNKRDEKVDGVLGMLGLRAGTLTLHMTSGTMTISDAPLSPDEEGVMPFRTTHDQKILIPMRLSNRGGIERVFWATLDTGHNSSLLLNPTSTLECLDRSRLAYRAQAVGVHGEPWTAAYFPTYGPVRIGGIAYEGVVAGANQASNNIGVGMLEGCRVRIDWASKLVQIVRNDGATRLISCESLGFFAMHEDPDGYRASVIPGSVPEQLGLTHRQIVTRINGEAIDSRFDMTRMWPVPADAAGVELEYYDPVTGEMGAVVVPID